MIIHKLVVHINGYTSFFVLLKFTGFNRQHNSNTYYDFGKLKLYTQKRVRVLAFNHKNIHSDRQISCGKKTRTLPKLEIHLLKSAQ